MAQIFLSYSRQSAEAAEFLRADLTELGHDVWIDGKLSGGQSWWNEILRQIRDCAVFVLVLDPSWVGSAACRREYDYARQTLAPVLPVQVSDQISVALLPSGLQQVQFVPYLDHAQRDSVLRLARALGTLPDRPALPDPLPDPPEVPVSYIAKIADRIAQDGELDRAAQQGVLYDLQKALADEAAAEDARLLLRDFRKRDDLLAMIAEDVDKLTQSEATASLPGETAVNREQSATTPTEPEPLETPAEALQQSPRAPEVLQSTPDPGKDFSSRTNVRDGFTVHLTRATIGAIVGSLAGLGAMWTYSSIGEEIWLGFFVGGPGALYLLIAASNAAAHWIALLGGVAGFFVPSLFESFRPSAFFAASVLFGSAPGIVIGAMLGRMLAHLFARKT